MSTGDGCSTSGISEYVKNLIKKRSFFTQQYYKVEIFVRSQGNTDKLRLSVLNAAAKNVEQIFPPQERED
ncbi:MAG: hypothetical protein AYP45_01010 [Candidatus Brocadia carolinensis]|uniref:Uncharacterized protein n=1 Tax=Candidatus Brocadia carolinensis TaxID=1004156 RepID=A0A1V4AXM0_9BACT|nr:MAG: hypothetical protein AYP45_01010 [Candidatus Brocadia caroliniensis]